MKQLLLILLSPLLVIGTSCTKSTDSNEYNSIWKPFSETKWTFLGKTPDEFKATNGGFSFAANIADTGTYTYTFIPSIYIVSNITTANDGALSFKGMITSNADSIFLSAGGYQMHSFGVLNGSIQSRGADSILTNPKSFNANIPTMVGLSVNPDSCSREIRFNVTVTWNPFSGGPTVNPLPKQKKIAIEFSDVQMRVNGIDVLSE
ncbi:MAG: hypothetical protein HYV29_04770 [Ignavibacteriales bacterium]|nr:hypothetical protein [Ignavibacteriales bacterium]